MDRAEKIGLGVATAGHVLLIALLSASFLATRDKLTPPAKPIDISLVDAVALDSAAPKSDEAPDSSRAPDTGAPEDAAAPAVQEIAPAEVTSPPPQPVPQPRPTPPEPARAEPAKAPPRPQPAPAPAPKPSPPKPAPAKAVPAKPTPSPAKPAPARPTTAPARPSLARPNVQPESGTSARPTAAAKPRGSLLGDDFRKSLAVSASPGKAQAPRSSAVSAAAVAGLADAIARQVQPCANRIPNPGPGANLIRSKLRLRMNADGTLSQRPALMGQTGTNDENGRYAQRVAELATSAIIQCAPYKLPAELYDGGWEDIIINYRLPG